VRVRGGGGAFVSGSRWPGIRFGDYERALMHYAILWAPYGGPPPDETLPIFGILSYELPERIREIAHRTASNDLVAEDRVLLARALAACPTETTPPPSVRTGTGVRDEDRGGRR
jgi:hypothetical protein